MTNEWESISVASVIERRLIIDRISGAKVILPRYTLPAWWEADVALVTKSNYLHEYEIKVSRSDFFADFKKEDHRKTLTCEENKHEALAKGALRYKFFGPSCFWFVTPKGLVSKDEIPEHAGHIEAEMQINEFWEERTDDYYEAYDCRLSIVKKAPRLHRSKVDDGYVQNIIKTGYNRYVYGCMTLIRLSSQNTEREETQ